MKHIIKQKLPRIDPTTLIKSLGRLTLIATFSLSLGTWKNWGHYNSYWHGTIFRVQTVDFNMLSHTLPGKLSYTLLQGNIGELQRTLDSNYGLFGLIVTDCKISTKDCLSEQILYQSKSSQQWTKEISLATLSNHPYDLLQNPPPLQAERQYAKPRDSKPIPTGRVNSGEIIGRVYYVRGVPPTFIEDYNNWIKNPFQRTGSRTLYTLTVALFFVSGLSAWIIIEVVLSAKRNEQHLAQQQREQLEREIQQIKLQLEEKNQQTIELIDQRERGLAELESYRQEQEQNKRELENQIASYESELALKEQQQQETAQT
ncbi:MAG: chromosome partitioning protein ParA, partial [Microcoleus sp.]